MFKIFKMFLKSGKASPQNPKSPPESGDWLSWKPDNNPPSAPAGFVKLAGAGDVSVAGTSFRLSDCQVVLSALNGDRVDNASIHLTHEDANPDHPNAIKVVVKLRHRDCHIGYLPSDISDMITHGFSKGMPLKAALREWGKKKTGDAVFFKISVFIPVAKDRKGYVKSPKAG